MRNAVGILVGGATLLCASGCTLHNVKYNAFCKNQIAPTERATMVHGSIDEAKAILEQGQLPHNTVRERFELERQAGRALCTQLGSPDYIVIGEVYGGGNARASIGTLEEAFCKRAAREGADVVMIFNSGVEERPFTYSTPGYAHTNVYSSACRSGNYAYGNATAYTTYTPGQTYSGVLRLPHANGLLFKHVPGIEEKRNGLARLDDAALERALAELERMRTDKNLTFARVLERWDELIEAAEPTSPGASAGAGPQLPPGTE